MQQDLFSLENTQPTPKKQQTAPLAKKNGKIDPILHTQATETIFSVSQYTTLLKQTLEGHIPPAWVRGEVSNLKEQNSGHLYFTLKDLNSQLSVVLFRGTAQQQSVKVKNGQSLIIFGEISLYEPRGQYQMIARCLLDEGEGKLRQAFERLKEKLQHEGLFDPENKKALPALPKTIGIITSPTGAVIQDFVRILERGNWTGTILLFATKVQGPGAMAQIIEHIEYANTYPKLDLLILARGGGSLEDLWVFNEEAVVRALAKSTLPTISAIGHETDFTLCDFVADKRAETPSAAANWILQERNHLHHKYLNALKNFQYRVEQTLQLKLHSYELWSQKLKHFNPQHILESHALRLDELQNRLQLPIQQAIIYYQKKISQLEQRLNGQNPAQKINFYRLKLQQEEKTLHQSLKNQLLRAETQLEHLKNRLEKTHPQQLLMRGFVYVTNNKNQFITEQKTLKSENEITLHFKDGTESIKLS